MPGPLAPIFAETPDEVRVREKNALATLLRERSNRVVLFGAGTLGRRARKLLQECGADVLAFSDNDTSRWGSTIDGCAVISPEEAASRYGKSAVFLVTIWNDHHWFGETHTQLTRLGCTSVSTYAPLFWRYGDSFMTLLLLNEPPHQVYLAAESVLRAETLWFDEESLSNYRANIRWRALGEAHELPGRPTENTYFPRDLFSLNQADSVLDCGAFDGDTIRELLSRVPNIPAMHAVEADAISCDRLCKFVDTLDPAVRNRIHLLPCAIGKERGFLAFESTGTLTSRASDSGTRVPVERIDDLFAETSLSLIKMDIEGAEYDALLGARGVLERDQPILAICVYHTQSDIWRIPLLVHEILPGHRLFLRSYEGDGFQTVMYAVPPARNA
jgi:FkbM family methyltransferase